MALIFCMQMMKKKMIRFLPVACEYGKKQDINAYRHIASTKKHHKNRWKCLVSWKKHKTRSAPRKVEIGRCQNSESLLHGKCKIRNYLLFALDIAWANATEIWLCARWAYIFAVIVPVKSQMQVNAEKYSCGRVDWKKRHCEHRR